MKLIPEIQFEDGVPIVPNVRPVIIVKGRNFDIGYQWFTQYANIFGEWILQDMRKSLSKKQREILEVHKELISQYTPEFIDIIRGMEAASKDQGVDITFDEILAEFCVTDQSSVKPADEASDCSGFAAWGSRTTGGELLAVGIGDMNKIKFEHTVIVYPDDGNAFIVSPYGKERGKISGLTWSPLHPGMNDRGLAYVHHGNGSGGREQKVGTGIPAPFMHMHVLRYAANCSEAKKMLLDAPSYQRGFYADTGGDAFVLECRDPLAIRTSGYAGEKDYLFSTNNCLCRNLEEYQEPGARYIPRLGWEHLKDFTAISRNVQLCNMFDNYGGRIDEEFMKMICRFPGEPPRFSSLSEAEAEYLPLKGRGWESPVSQLTNEMVGVMRPDDGGKGKMWISSTCPGKRGLPRMPKGYYFVANHLYTFFELDLAGSPDTVVDMAYDHANFDMCNANMELRKLDYHDPAYYALGQFFDKAVVEWTKGDEFRWRARNASGNEAMTWYGRALRAFTRSQAYANHVYEALVPPAESPEDLGLKPLFYPGGEWMRMPE